MVFVSFFGFYSIWNFLFFRWMSVVHTFIRIALLTIVRFTRFIRFVHIGSNNYCLSVATSLWKKFRTIKYQTSHHSTCYDSPAFNRIVRQICKMALFDCSSLSPNIKPLQSKWEQIGMVSQWQIIFRHTYKLAMSYGPLTSNAFNAPPVITIFLAFLCETKFCATIMASLRWFESRMAGAYCISKYMPRLAAIW